VLKVKEETSLSFSLSGEVGCEELESCIKKAGIWGDVSALNLSRLAKLLMNEDLEEKARHELLQYAKKVCKVDVRMKKKDENEY